MTDAKQTQFEYPEPVKKAVGWFGKYIFMPIIAIILVVSIFSQVTASFPANQLYPASNAKYEAAVGTLCPLIKQKATDKLQDDANGVLPEKDFDRNLTAKYRDMDCSKVKISVNVDFQN